MPNFSKRASAELGITESYLLGGLDKAKGGNAKWHKSRTIQASNTKSNLNVLSDTSPDPSSGLVYFIQEDEYGRTGKMQKMRSVVEVACQRCTRNGFNLCRDHSSCGEKLQP